MLNKDLTVSQTIHITADVAAVWDALTNPEKIKVYLFGTEAISTWQQGDIIIFQGEYKGQAYKDKGQIEQINPGQLLTYRYWSGFSGLPDIPENYCLVSYQLDQDGDQILLTLKQVGFANEEAQLHSVQGWSQVLKTIKEMTEGS
jgi:uncharacterized protein YndB with AHSA1/START domain